MSNLDFSLRFRALKFVSDISSNFRLIRAIWTALRNFSPFLPVPVGSARLQTGSVRFRTVASNCGSALFRTESGVSSWKVPSDFGLLYLDSDISAGFRILPYDFIFFHSIQQYSVQFSTLPSYLRRFCVTSNGSFRLRDCCTHYCLSTETLQRMRNDLKT